jgi:hypothetical protein
MTEFRMVAGWPPPDTATSPAPTPDTAQIRVAAAVTGVLAVVGCVLGLVWAWWSPPGPEGERIPAGTIADETEAFIGADGRYLILTGAVGLVGALLAWRLRSARGPWVAAALGAGGVLGALLTDLVGHLTKGASQAIPLRNGAVGYQHLALSVHATGLLFVEGALAALVYGLLVAFTAYDDLGRPDPVRAGLRPDTVEPEGTETSRESVQAGWQPDDRWRHRDAPGSLQQRDFPPQ